MLVLEWKERAFIEKVNSRCFCWFPAAILVHQNGAPIWRLHTKLYKGAWNVSANNSETMAHKDLRGRQILYILVFYNISFSCLLPLEGFQFNFFAAWQWKRSIRNNSFIYPRQYFSIALVLVGPSKWLKEIIQIKHNRIKNLNWPEANRLAVYKRGLGSELGATVNKSS